MIDLNNLPEVLQVDVTKEDIAAGKGCECYSCPIALALARCGLPIGPDGLGVNRKYVFSGEDDSTRVEYYLPERVARWVDRYDGRAASRPLSFQLRRFKP